MNAIKASKNRFAAISQPFVTTPRWQSLGQRRAADLSAKTGKDAIAEIA